jgi:hypothetical protein
MSAPQQPEAQSTVPPLLYVKGVIRVVLTQNIGRRAFQADKITPDEVRQRSNLFTGDLNKVMVREQAHLDDEATWQYRMFERFRGTTEFAEAVKSLRQEVQQSGLFSFDEEAVEIQSIGYKLRVLSHHLYKNELMPIYILNKKELERRGIRPQVKLYGEAKESLRRLDLNEEEITERLNENLLREWYKWPVMKIMLSRYGMYQVVLERDFPNWTPITEVLRSVTGLEQKLELSENPTLKKRKEELAAEIRQTKSDLAQLRSKSAQPEAAEVEIQPEAVAEAAQLRAQFEAAEAQLDKDKAHIKEVKNRIKVLEKQLVESSKSDEDVETVQNSIDYSVQWEVVREIVAKFVRAFNSDMSVTEGGTRLGHPQQTIKLHFNDEVWEATADIPYDLRFRYVIFELYRLQRGGQEISAAAVSTKDELQQELAGLLEGVLLTGQAPGELRLAPVRKERIDYLLANNASTWNDEYCMFSRESAVICHYPMADIQSTDGVLVDAAPPGWYKYRYYWTSIMRGVGYLCELRVLAELLESHSTNNLQELATYLPGFSARNSQSIEEDWQNLSNITSEVSNSSRLLASLRDAIMLITVGIADYAVTKYHYLLRVLDLEKLIEHTHNNFTLLDSTLARYRDILQQSNSLDVQRGAKRDSRIMIGLTIVLIAITIVIAGLTLPTFFTEMTSSEGALAQVFTDLTTWPDAHNWIKWTVTWVTIGLVPVTIIAIFVGLWGIRHNDRLRRDTWRRQGRKDKNKPTSNSSR